MEQASTKDPLMRRLQAVFKAIIPFAGKTLEAYGGDISEIDPTGLVPESHRYAHPDTTAGRFLYYVAKLLGGEPAIRPDGYEERMAGAGIRGRKARLDKVIWSVYYETQNLKPDEVSEFIQRELPNRVKNDELPYAYRKLITLLQRMPERYMESQVEGEMYEQGMQAPYGMVGQ
jgi:hypothetical protein